MFWISLAFAAELVAIPGTAIQLPETKGFTVQTAWTGTGNEKSGAAVLVVEIPAPAATILESLTPEALASRGVLVRTQSETRIYGYGGKWFEGDNAAGGVFAMAVVGDEQKTWMIKATAPNAAKLKPAAAQVKGAVWGAPAEPDLAFSVAAPAGMARAFALAGSELFSVGGVMVSEPATPYLVVAPAMRPVVADEATARQLMVSITGLTGVEVRRCTRYEREGRVRFDLEATARDTGNAEGVGKDVEMVVWHRVYFSGTDYLRALAVAPASERDTWEPAFQASLDALSWQAPGASAMTPETGYTEVPGGCTAAP